MNHRLLQVVLGGALLALEAPILSAGTVAVRDAKIVEVTVFRDRAEVVREARVDLPRGASTVELAGLPIGVEPDSLRVTAEGVPATLGAVELRDEAEKPVDSPEFLAAQDEVRGLERAIATLDAAKSTDAELRSFLGGIRAAVAKSESEKLAEGSADPQAIAGVYQLLRDRYASLAEADLARNEERRALQEKLAVARAELETVRPRADIRSRVATVEVEARSAGALELRVAYLVPGASWRPSYRAFLDVEKGDVNLTSEGVVRQITGEDWADVELHLSTAAPAEGVQPPLLESWFLRPGADFARAQAGFALAPGVQDADGDGNPNVSGSRSRDFKAAAEAVIVADVAQAAVEPSAYNVTFVVPGRSDVPADGRDHRVTLRSESLAGKIEHRSVPSLAPLAYLTSVTTSPRDYPLLAGPVRVFVGGAYLGSFHLEEKGPGLELTLPFGLDNRVEIIRVPLPRTAGKGGVGGNKREVEYAFQTKIHNLQDREVTLVLEERVPVSEDERIQVELDKETTPGWKPSERRPGVMLWTLTLKPKEKQDVVLAYTVRFPKDLFVPGLP